MTPEEIREEVKNLPRNPDDCWSSDGARWVAGFRSGLKLGEVLEAERGARLGFTSRQACVDQVKEGIKRMAGRAG